jgi:hypothetical protein
MDHKSTSQTTHALGSLEIFFYSLSKAIIFKDQGNSKYKDHVLAI